MKKLGLTVLATSCALSLTACGGLNSLLNKPTPVVAVSTATQAATATTQATTASTESQKATAAKTAADGATTVAVAQSELAKAQAAQTATKTAADAAQKAADDAVKANATSADTTKAKEQAAKAKVALETANKAVEDIKAKIIQLEEKAKADAQSQALATSFKTAIDGAFRAKTTSTTLYGDLTQLETKYSSSYDELHTSVLAVNNKTGAVSTTINPLDKPEFESITINGMKILLLATPTDRLSITSLRPLEARDYRPVTPTNPETGNTETVSLPQGAKGGFVGSINHEDQNIKSAFNSMRFGVYTDENNISHLFVHGKPKSATSMRDEKKYNFTGSAVIGKGGDYKALSNAVTAVVDFGKKDVDINIKVDDTTTLNFGGNIKGNTFEGTRNGIVTRGGFFGNYQSTQLGGFYQVTEGAYKDHNGVYGATQGSEIK